MCAKRQLKSRGVTGCNKPHTSLLHQRQCTDALVVSGCNLGFIVVRSYWGATGIIWEQHPVCSSNLYIVGYTHPHTHRSIYNTITPESRNLEQSCNIKSKRLFCSTSAVSQFHCFYLKRSPPEHFMCFHPAAFLKSGATDLFRENYGTKEWTV